MFREAQIAAAFILLLVQASTFGAAPKFISVPNRTDMVHHGNKNYLYISAGSRVLTYDLNIEGFRQPFETSGALLGIDLSPDGNLLAVADAASTGSGNWIHLIDLRSNAVSKIDVNGTTGAGTFAVAFGFNGKLLISSQFAGSGGVILKLYDPLTGQMTDCGGVTQNSMLRSSGDRKLIGVAEANISSGPVHLFDIATAQLEAGTGHGWFNYEIAVNKNGTQLASPTYGGMFVYDRNYRLITKIGEYAGLSPVGLAYHPNKDAIFTAWAGTSEIRVLNTTSFSELGRFTLPSEQRFEQPGNGSFAAGRMKLSEDGSKVFVSVPGGIAWFEHGLTNLPTFYSVIVRGSPFDIGNPVPNPYGTNYIPAGTVVTQTVSETAELDGTRYRLASSTLEGLKLLDAGSASSSVSFEVTTNGVLQLDWNPTHQLLTARAIGAGNINITNAWVEQGKPLTLTATPNAGYEFIRWIGQVPDELAQQNPLTLTMDQPRLVNALFSNAGSSSGLIGDWPTFGRDMQHSGYFPGVLGSDRFTYRWTAAFSDQLSLNQVAIAEGKVYVTPFIYFNEPFVAALNENSGQTIWRRIFPPNPFSMNPPTYADGALYFQRGNHDADTQLYKLDAKSGNTIWKAPLNAQWERYFAPVVADGRVWAVGGSYGGLYGHNAATGERLFFQGGPQYDQWTPAYWDGRLFSFVVGTFRELNPTTGETLWSHDLGWSLGGLMNRSISISNGRAFVVNNPDLAAFDLVSKKLLWRIPGNFSGTPASAKGVVYVNEGGSVSTFTASTGQKMGTFSSASNAMNQPIVTDDVLITSDRSSTSIFDLVKRTLVQTIAFGGEVSLANGSLFIANQNGQLQSWTTSKDFKLLISADGPTIGNPEPYPYGTNNAPQNGTITNSVASAVELNGTRYVANGWQLSGVQGVGTSNSVSFRLTNDAQLTWKWTVSEQQFLAFVSGKGSVSVTNAWVLNGGELAVTALPETGMRFVGWSGNLPQEQRTNTSLVLKMDQPRRVTAVFLPAASSQDPSAEWPTLGFDPGHSSHVPGVLGTNQFHWRWTQGIGSGLQQVSIGRNRVFTTLISGFNAPVRVSTFSPFSGQPLWTSELGVADRLSPATYWDDGVYVQRAHSGDSFVHRLDAANGAAVWASPYGAQFPNHRAPVVSDGYVFVYGGAFGGLYGYKASDGAQLFFQQLDQQDGWTPAYWQGRLFSLVSGKFREHSLRNGEPLWTLTLSTESSNGTVTPVVAEGRAFAVVGGVLTAIDLATQQVAWKQNGQFRSMPAVANGVLYIRDGSSISRFSSNTGDRLTELLLTGNLEDQGQQPIVTDDSLIVPIGTTTLVFDLASDTLRQTIPASGAASLADGVLYLVEASGNLQAWSLYPEEILVVASSGPRVGRPYPFTYGSNYVPLGREYEATVIPDESPGQGTRIVAKGWTGTGSIPSSGTSSVVKFRFTQESTLTWNWSTQHLVRAFFVGSGTIDKTNEWVLEGQTITLQATPAPYFRFAGWTGSTTNAAAELTLQVDAPHNLTAIFLPVILTNGVPEWWLAQYDLPPTDAGALADSDQDGLSNWQEYRSQTIPTKVDSDSDGYSDGTELGFGSDPLSPASVPSLSLSIISTGNGGLVTPLGYGTHQLPFLSTNSITALSLEYAPGARIVPVGWIGTGSVPATGAGTNLTFVLATNSTLKWLWETQYLVSVRQEFLLQNSNTNPLPVSTLSLTNGVAESGFGTSVSISERRAAVGSPFATIPGSADRLGTVSTYEFNGRNWSLTQAIYPADSTIQGFGANIALAGTNLAITAVQGNVPLVYTYVLLTNTWQLSGVINPRTAIQSSAEAALAWADNSLFIGLPSVVGNGVNGVVFVFQRTLIGWLNRSQYQNQSHFSEAREQFGAALASQGNLLLVGAPGGRDLNGAETGAAYLIKYDPETFSRQSALKINPTDLSNLARFGSSVAMLGADILIGAPDNFGGGSAFLYRVSDTGAVSFRAQLRSPVPRMFDGFGASVALGPAVALASAPEADGASSFGGAVHLFSLLDTSWTGELRSSGPSIGGLFGYSISAQGGAVLVGAPDEANQAGRSHVYDLGQTSESAPVQSWVSAGTLYSPVFAPSAITQDGQEYAFVGWELNRKFLVSTNGEPVNPPPSVALSDPIELVAHYRGTRREPVPSELRLSISRAAQSGIITFQVEGVPGENYTVESVPSLFEGRWSESMQFVSTNRVHILDLPGTQTGATNKFFRVRRN